MASAASGMDHQPICDGTEGFFSLGEALSTILRRGLARLGTQKASAFLFDPATRRLRLVASTRDIPVFELGEDEGIAGQTLRRIHDTGYWLANRSDLKEHYRSSEDEPSSLLPNLTAVLSVGIRLLGDAAVVLCFDFQEDAGAGQSLSQVDKHRARFLAKNLLAEPLRQLLVRAWIKQVHQDIRAAGLIPNDLRRRAAEFVAEFQRALHADGHPKPHALEIELVDRRRDVIHTLHSTSLPIGFEDAASHPLDSADIQAEIVRTLRPEMIAGNDRERFDQWVFRRLEHAHLRRLWIPLIPFHASMPSYAPRRLPAGQIRRRLCWQDGKTIPGEVICRQASWIEAAPPPGAAYGTFSISYRRTDPRSGVDLSPWTDELANWCIQKAWELGEPLFLATLPGALERIGQLSFSIGAAKEMQLVCAGPHPGEEELRTYPTQEPWQFAHPALRKPETTAYCEPERLEYGDEVVRPRPGWDIPRLREETRALAIESMRWACELYGRALEAFELHDTSRHIRSLLGTEVEDPVVKRICGDASREAGALSARFYTFDLQRRWADTPWPQLLGSATESTQPVSSRFGQDDEYAQAEIQARQEGHPPAYLPSTTNLNPPKALLPFELADQTMGVLVLSFPHEEQFASQRRQSLERRASRWAQRLSMHRLILGAHFSRVMARLRQDVIAAEDSADVDNFLERFLKAAVKTLEARGGLVSFHSAPIQSVSSEDANRETHLPEVGPSRMVRLLAWCENKDEAATLSKDSQLTVARRETVGGELGGSCQAATAKGEVVCRDTRQALEFDTQIRWLSEQFEMHGSPACQAAAEWLKGLGAPGSVVTIPIPLRADRVRHRVALSFFLPQIHSLRRVHVQQLTEFGVYLGEALASTSHRTQRRVRIRHEQCVAERCARFAKEEEQDGIVGVLLAGLGMGNSSLSTPASHPASKYGEKWGLADDAVLWVGGQSRQEIVARSGRGVGFEIIKSRPVCQRNEHPWFQENGRLIARSEQRWEILTPGLRLFACRLSQRPERYCKVARDLSKHDWMVSFPIVDAQSRFFGLVDLFRPTPFEPEEHEVVEDQLKRLILEFCSAVERSRYRRVGKFELNLHAQTAALLQSYKTGAVHRTVAEALKKHFNCRHCDLFLRESEQLILVATTRLQDLVGHDERWGLTVSSGEDDPLSAAMATRRPILRRVREDRGKPTSLSAELVALLAECLWGGRLIVPIMDVASEFHDLVGMFQLTERIQQDRKRSSVFSSEDVVEAMAIAGSLEPILRLVRVIDEHGVHVNELVHSLGQPLQRLRNDQYLLKRLVASETVGSSALAKLSEANQNLDDDFKAVEEARDRLGFLARLYRPDDHLKFERVVLGSEIQEAIRAAQRLAGNVTFVPDLGDVNPVPVQRAWMRQTLANLLDNAAKYSYRGGNVHVSLREANGEITIVVENLGIGIPQGDIKRIFQPYYRSRVPDRRGTRQGSGLGLTVVREAVEQVHRGHVEVSSIPRARHCVAGDSAEAIQNVGHLTIFKVRLSRPKLEELAEIQNRKEDYSSG